MWVVSVISVLSVVCRRASRRSIGRRRQEPLAALIVDGAGDDLVHGFMHHQPVTIGQRDVRIGQTLHVPNQFGIEDEWLAVESGKFDQAGFRVRGSGMLITTHGSRLTAR